MVKKAEQAKPNFSLKVARRSRGWTQRDVADRIGSPLALNVTRWERGTATPSAYYVQRLCQLFEMTPQELGLLTWEDAESITIPSLAPGNYWNVPYRRNPFFTGREDILTRLEQQLSHQYAAALTQSYALSGLGGIGKTQIAIEYAYRYSDTYGAVFWVRAASRETLLADYVALAQLVSLPQSEGQDETQIVAAMKRWLAQQEGWLMILDNADDLSLLTDFLPDGRRGHLLLTTRAQATGMVATSIAIDTMPAEEGCLLLLRRAKLLSPATPLEAATEQERATALTLVKELDALPLALDQAGAYVEETGCTLEEYLMLYRQRRLHLLQHRSKLPSEYPHTVASTWSLSFRQVENENPAAAELLRLCAFLDPDAIPEFLLSEGVEHLGLRLSPVVVDPLLLNDALRTLRRYSFIGRHASEKTLSLHRLVQAVLKENMSEEARQQWAERAIGVVNAAFPEVEITTWSRCQQCLPHAMACIALIEQHHIVSPEAGRLLTFTGWFLREKGLYEQAEPLHRRALAIQEQALGPFHLDVATTLDNLGYLQILQRRYEEAKALLGRALRLREQALGSEHRDTILVLHALGNAYRADEQYEQANTLLQRALTASQHTLGSEDPETASLLVALGHVCVDQGYYTQAELFYQQAEAIFEHTTGFEYLDAVEFLKKMGQLYILQGKYAQAESYLQRSLLAHEKLVGLEHPDTAGVLHHLAQVHLEQGHTQEALTLLRQVRSIYEHTMGPEDPWTAGSMIDLGRVFTFQGCYEQAQALQLEALVIYKMASGKESINTAITCYWLAQNAYRWQRLEQAETLCRQAQALFEHILSPDNAWTASTHHLLAQISTKEGRYAQAHKDYRQAIAIREHVLSPRHPLTEQAKQEYAALLRKKEAVRQRE